MHPLRSANEALVLYGRHRSESRLRGNQNRWSRRSCPCPVDSPADNAIIQGDPNHQGVFIEMAERHYAELCLAGRIWRLQRERFRSEEHTSELQSPCNLVCRLLLAKKT